jgi:hypothetical protein
MKKNTLTIIFLLLLNCFLLAQTPKDIGESKEYKALKDRTTEPAATDIDKSVTLDSLLAKNDEKAWQQTKGAAIEGYVIQVEKEEDGDYHIVMSSKANEIDTKKWVIVEVTQAWQKKKANLAAAKLRDFYGKKIRVTGWLFYEPDVSQPDPRGTRWEIHPVTNIEIVGS